MADQISMATAEQPGQALSGSAFVALMRRYCLDYTNRHDLSIPAQIMDPSYTLNMGPHRLAGRDSLYLPAARVQFTQFPGLCLTVHQIVSNGSRLVMRFTEHGRSTRHDGRAASWSGIGLYRWDGTRLLENFVEQDYSSRALQLDGAAPLPVEPPALSPWDTLDEPANPAAEAVVRQLIASNRLLAEEALVFDDEWLPGRERDPLIHMEGARIDDLFSAGDHVAFKLTVTGRLNPAAPFAGQLAPGANPGETPVELHLAAVVRLQGDRLVWGRGVRNRIELKRGLERQVK